MLPAMANLHSHSFQRSMAGMTEKRVKKQDSFWSWRKLMYSFLEQLNPEHVEAIAALAFMEMLESGYASVGEFHYLHHQQRGQHYENIAETSSRIIAAALQNRNWINVFTGFLHAGRSERTATFQGSASLWK